jgi:HEAT repeat protein
MPVLRSLLRESSPELREGAMVALWNLRPQSAEAIPEIIEYLSMTNNTDLNLPILLLSSFGEASKAAVPTLERLLETPGIPQDTVAAALWLIDRRTNTALQHLTNRIEDFTGNNAFVLGRMGEAGRPAIPHLLQGVKSKTGNVRMNSARALWKIAPEYLPRAIAAVLEPLTNHLQRSGSGLDSQGAAWYAASVLREFGTHAASARWALERGSTNSDPNVAEECRKALQALNP